MGTWQNKIAIALSAVAVVGFGAYAWAADLNTVNTSEAYADPMVAAGFMTVPTDCAAAPDSVDNVTACNALGQIAIEAIQGEHATMQYWQGSGLLDMMGTEFFVPSTNLFNMTAAAGGGIAPIFSKNDRNLFGRSDELMGIYTREEMLFMGLTLGIDAHLEQTAPGNDAMQDMVIYLLTQPEGVTSVSVGALTFDYTEMKTYTNLTGFTSGKATTITNYCSVNYPGFGALCFNVSFAAQIYLADNAPGVIADSCGAGDPFCSNRDMWIDQTVVGYVTSLDKDTAAEELAQNFSSQITFDVPPTDISTLNYTLLDQRLDQSVELGQAEFEASRQTFQQAFRSRSADNFYFGTPVDYDASQLVSQDVEGYLFSCMNCDTPELVGSGGSHAFLPPLTSDQIDFIPYWSNWHTVPTITHAPAL